MELEEKLLGAGFRTTTGLLSGDVSGTLASTDEEAADFFVGRSGHRRRTLLLVRRPWLVSPPLDSGGLGARARGLVSGDII